MKQRRDQHGLTEKMRASLPLVAAAKSRHQGVLECAELGIVTESHFYRTWMHDDHYVRAVNLERDRVQGASIERCKSFLVAYDEVVMEKLVQVCIDTRNTKQIAAIRLYAEIVGHVTKGGDVNVTTNVVQTASGKQLRFRDTIASANQARAKRLAELGISEGTARE